MRIRSLLMIALLVPLSLLLSGCLESDISTDERIILNAQAPNFTVPVKSDRSSVEWYLDEKLERKEEVDEDMMARYLLDRDDFQEGNYVLKVEDGDSKLEWEFTVFHDITPDEVLEIKQRNSGKVNDRGYGHFTNFQERHEKAREYWDS